MLRDKLKGVLAQMRAMHDKIMGEARAYTAEEDAEYARLKGEAEELRKQIERDDEVETITRSLPEERSHRQTPAGDGTDNRGAAGDGKVRNFGHFIELVAMRGGGILEERAITTQSGGSGFMIPEVLHPDVLSLDPLEEIMAPRAMVIPPGAQPDAKEIWPALEQGTSGVFAGMVFEWTEQDAAPSADSAPTVGAVELNPHELIGTWTVSQKLLRNASAYSTVLTRLFQMALRGIRDRNLIKGDGVGKPLGVLKSACKIDVKRNTASTVKYVDLLAMIQAIPPSLRSKAMWINSTDALATVEGLCDTVGRPIFGMGDISQGRPISLCGLELKYSDCTSALGTAGDINLVVPSLYMYKVGYGPVIALSEHYDFKKGNVVFRIVQSLDGQCWVKAALTLENAHKVSPVVSLK